MRLSLFAAAALCMSTLAAHADTITVYSASGLFSNGQTLSGTLTLDETTGVFTAANLFGGFTYVSQDNNFAGQGYSDVVIGLYDGSVLPEINLDFDTLSFVNYQGGNVGSSTTPAKGAISGVTYHGGPFVFLEYGALTPAQTPEPSSIALLGTGLIGMFGVARRKYMSA